MSPPTSPAEPVGVGADRPSLPEAPRREVRYSREDGMPIDDYSWVVDPDFLEDGDATRYVVEVWDCRLVERRIEVHGWRELCPRCEGEGEINDGAECPACKGSCEGPETPYVAPCEMCDTIGGGGRLHVNGPAGRFDRGPCPGCSSTGDKR